MKRSLMFFLLSTVLVSQPGLAQIFAGTGGFGGGVANDAVEVDAMSGTTMTAFSGQPVWGATNDPANSRVLFTTSGGTTDGADLWAWPHAGGAPSVVCTISTTNGELRIDGLAMSGGTLYGAHQFDAGADLAGVYSIDLAGSCAAVSVLPFVSGAISGIDADPSTGMIYGTDDTNTALVELDVVGGMINTVAAYPAGETDLDGLAVSGDGVAYLIPDDANSPISVYDLTMNAYQASLPTPWGATDTFSGGAFIEGPVPVELEAFSID